MLETPGAPLDAYQMKAPGYSGNQLWQLPFVSLLDVDYAPSCTINTGGSCQDYGSAVHGPRPSPRGIHVAYVVIDGAVDGLVRQFLPNKPDDFFVKPSAIAETVHHLAQQDRSAWTFELDLRTSTEKW